MRILDLIFPKRAADRLRLNALEFELGEERVKRESLEQSSKRSFDGASRGRLNSTWPISPGGPNDDVRSDLVTLRTRARDLEQNNAYARRYLNLSKKNIPGPYGFIMKPRVFDLIEQSKDGKKRWVKVSDKVANIKIAEAWAAWCRKENCDVSGQDSFRQIQHLLTGYIQRDNEYLIRKVVSKRARFGFQLQVLEPDLIDESYNAVLSNGNVVIMGIELDKWRKRVAFHLKSSDVKYDMYGPGVVSSARERVSADQMYYDFDKLRAFQARGVTKMSAAMVRFFRIEEYEKANNTNAVISARRLGFLETKVGEDYTGTTPNSDGNIEIESREGSFTALPPGVSANIPDPTYPDDQYEAFMKTALRGVSSGLDMSYITMGNDLTETSFSSGRQGLQDERETFMVVQEWIIESFLEPVFRDWLPNAILSGELNLPMAKLEKFSSPLFVGRRWPWIDPERDANAKLIKLRSAQSSLQRECAENGDDWEELLDEKAEAEAAARDRGTTLDFGGASIPKPPAQEPPAIAPVKKNGTPQSVTA
jgi:lambda family phage portal protein